MNGLPKNDIVDTAAIESELLKLAGQQDATNAIEAVQHVVKEGDVDRLMTGCTLLNAFNYAIQRQAGRNEWTPDDFRAFSISLAAMYQIK